MPRSFRHLPAVSRHRPGVPRLCRRPRRRTPKPRRTGGARASFDRVLRGPPAGRRAPVLPAHAGEQRRGRTLSPMRGQHCEVVDVQLVVARARTNRTRRPRRLADRLRVRPPGVVVPGTGRDPCVLQLGLVQSPRPRVRNDASSTARTLSISSRVTATDRFARPSWRAARRLLLLASSASGRRT